MCYSFTTSIISYVLGIISGIFALMTRQFTLGILILTYSQMQFAELLIWYGIDTQNDDVNRFGTSYGKYLLATHNIAIGLGIILSIIISKKTLKIIDFIPLIIGILFFLYILFIYYLPNKFPDLTLPLDPKCVDNTNKCQNPNNRLKWPWPHDWYIFGYLISVIILFLYIKPIESKILIFSVFTLTFIGTGIFNPKVIGSVWCFIAAIISPLLVYLNYLLIKDQQLVNLLT
jgi:hypothetical protein